jgi:subfamily B ATP-binding cassette protein MsbA
MDTAQKSLWQRFARIAPYFRSGRLGLVVAAIATAIGAATEPLIPALFKPLLDEGFAQRTLPLWVIPVAIVGLFAVRGIAGFIADYALAWTAHRGVLALRLAMFDHLMRAESALFSQRSASSLTNSLVYEVQQGANQLVQAVLTLAKDSLTVLALLGYLLWLNWELTLFVGILFPALAFVMRTVGRRLRRLVVAAQQATDELAYVVEENVLAWRIVRLHDAGPAQSERFGRRSDLLRRLMMKATVAQSTMTPTTQVLAALALSAVIVVALWQSDAASGTVGGFVSFITAMLMLLAPVKKLSDVMAPLTRGLAALERGIALIDDTPAEQGGAHAPVRARGEIELADVTLRYRDDGPPAIDRLSLRIAAGETVALVGPSGAGKSSVVHLLPRFVQPSAGEVRLDGVPLAQWDVRALRRQFALVSQDVVLFNDSVAANVALGAAVDEARVRAALEGAYLLDFVLGLPQGLQTPIGHNGSELSGGQRQRLAIARAIYKDAPVLILDEATSALDSESERAVQAALDTLMKGRTTLVIAHRLSTIEHADRVVVLDAGRLVERGTHAELIAAGGLYARLHAIQFRG